MNSPHTSRVRTLLASTLRLADDPDRALACVEDDRDIAHEMLAEVAAKPDVAPLLARIFTLADQRAPGRTQPATLGGELAALRPALVGALRTLAPNHNCLDKVVCPRCGSSERLYIVGSAQFLVHDDGTDLPCADIEWDDQSAARCPECGLSAPLGVFRGTTPPEPHV